MPAIKRINNADVIVNAADRYIADGAIVADVTFGKGAFWGKTDTRRFTLIGSDIATAATVRADFRHLPYRDASIDCVVWDPPYIHHGGTHATRDRYGLAFTSAMSHADIMDKLYLPGMQEAVRVLKPRGQLWVKCKDEIESGRQCWSHCEIAVMASNLGLWLKGPMIVVGGINAARWRRQLHARKVHSYLMIFER